MARILFFLYGLVAYFAFFGTIVYTIGFLINFAVPKGIDGGAPVSLSEALLYNVPFFLIFAIQHTIMARPAFKRWFTKIIPEAIERSTFVLVASLIMAALLWQWKPLPALIWSIENPVLVGLIYAVYATGWFLFFYSSFLIDHFDLFGLRQVIFYSKGMEYRHPPFMRRSLYNHVRHPLMLGILLFTWATPVMTQGHLLFSVAITGYILFGTVVEERDLVRILGEDYERYRKETPKLIPRILGPKHREAQAKTGTLAGG